MLAVVISMEAPLPTNPLAIPFLVFALPHSVATLTTIACPPLTREVTIVRLPKTVLAVLPLPPVVTLMEEKLLSNLTVISDLVFVLIDACLMLIVLELKVTTA
jgi:hypothetical protein